MLIAYLFAIILLALALTRLPSAIRGRNVIVMLAATAIVIAFVLITPAVYAALNPLLPVPNWADLISKLALFLGLLLAGTQIARAYNSADARRLISGLPGLMAFALLFIAEVVIFAFVYDATPVPGMEADLADPLVRVYAAIATAYAAYVAIVLIPALLTGSRSSERSARTTSLLLLLGFGLAIVRFGLAIVTLAYVPVYQAAQVVSGVAAIFVALGLTNAFFSRVIRGRRTQRLYV
ncbi:hypothetical protein ACLQ2Q_15450 [Microbacterium sp. DT81.1]|uniref:hypothetical protein n=1 Tax=Microbacterium sp. DT81.1 TaxID=3393413 RepID=UPI003CEC438F